MSVSFPKIPKAKVYYLITLMPKQSKRIATAVRSDLDKHPEKNVDFNAFMRGLFFSKDILRRTGYFHLKTLIENN